LLASSTLLRYKQLMTIQLQSREEKVRGGYMRLKMGMVVA